MAKKKSGGFNMSATIREMLEADPKLTGKEVLEALKAKYPKQKINPGSANVAYSNQRKALGIKGRKRKVVRRKPAAAKTTSVAKSNAGRPKKVASTGGVNMDALQAAREFIAAVGGVDNATAAIKQLQTLQLG